MADVLLVGGGTAGHVLPAIATAQALERLRPGIDVEFAGLSGSLEERLVSAAGYPFSVVRALPLPRRLTPQLLRVVPGVLGAVRHARSLLVETGASGVVSFGGYVALPLSLAARGRVPLVLHEQNSRPGLANRISARSASHIAVTFPSSAERLRGRARVRIVGNPVQQHLRDLDVSQQRRAATERLALDPNRRTLLVLGGSQGARSINRAVTGALEAWRALGLQVLHLTGERGHEESVGWWRDAGADPDARNSPIRVLPFLQDMSDAYAVADLAVSRAGATTIAELSVLGVPSVLVPYPHATAQHQHSNALALARCGAAVVIEDRTLSPDAIATLVATILEQPQRTVEMSRAARAWSRPDAAEALALVVLEAIEERDA